jgi:hypothetical protein
MEHCEERVFPQAPSDSRITNLASDTVLALIDQPKIPGAAQGCGDAAADKPVPQQTLTTSASDDFTSEPSSTHHVPIQAELAAG